MLNDDRLTINKWREWAEEEDEEEKTYEIRYKYDYRIHR